MGDDISRKYKTSHDSLKKQLEEEGVFRKFHNSDSDSSDFEEAGTAEYSPINKLRRSIKKAKALSKFEKMGLTNKPIEQDDDSDEEMRAVRVESEAWLKKQKDLEKQLMARASKGALKNRYMNKGAETHEDIPATEKRIDDLLERVIKDSNMKIKGKAGFSRSNDKRSFASYKAKTDMADIVKRALTLRQEVEAAKAKDKSKATRKTAKKPFPVKLESSSSESHISESESSAEDEVSDTSIKRFDIPELDSVSDSSEDEADKLEKYRKRSRPKFDFSKPSSFDLAEVDDVMAMEEAKRMLGKKPELWSSKPPGYKKYEPKQQDEVPSDNNSKSKSKLIETFPPEVEALRTKLALGDFGMSNREFLNSERLLSSAKKEIPIKNKQNSNAFVNEFSNTEVQQSKTNREVVTNKAPNPTRKVITKTGSKRDLLDHDSTKKASDKSRSFDKAKMKDVRSTLTSVRTPSKII